MDRIDQIKILLLHLAILFIGQVLVIFFMEITRQFVILQDRIPKEAIQGKSYQELSEFQKEIAKQLEEDIKKDPESIMKRFTEIIVWERNGLLLWLNGIWAISYLLPGYYLIEKKSQIRVSRLEDPMILNQILIGVYSAIGLFFVFNIIGYILKLNGIEIKNNFFQNYLFQSLKGNLHLLVWSIYSIAIITGIVEEWFFRGFLLKHYMDKNLTKEGWILTSVLFGVLHYNNDTSFIVPILLTGAGFVFGYLYINYKNIWVPIAAHITFNSINIIIAYFFGNIIK